MVFESIAVDILNRLLGDYFENLDASQIGLETWGGDVVLWDLLLRNSVFDDMNVPFKLLVGNLGTLRMKILWQSLYSSPIELNLIDLCLWVAPSHSVKAQKAAVPETQADSPFTKLIISHLTKNIQIKIQNIDIRYEDDVTMPRSPFGFGITLKRLEVHIANPIERIDELRRKEQGVPNAPAVISHLTKNVQIKIQTIDIRYEDDVTMPKSPFGFGITLKRLEVHIANPIERIDELRRKEQGVPNAQADSTFAKLISDLKNNVQIKIQTIHIRNEDDATMSQITDLGFEIILTSLEVHTTDPNRKPAVCGGVGGWRKKTTGRERRREGRKCKVGIKGKTTLLSVLYMFIFVSFWALFGFLVSFMV